MTITLETMYPQVVGNRAVKLASAFVAGTDTTISLTQVDSSAIPDATNKVTIIHKLSDTEQYLVSVKYTGISGTTLTGVTIDEYDVLASATHTFPVGSGVFRPFMKSDVTAITTNINTLNTDKVEFSTDTLSKELRLGNNATGIFIEVTTT